MGGNTTSRNPDFCSKRRTNGRYWNGCPAEKGTDYTKYFQKLKAKYPWAPPDIFPQRSTLANLRLLSLSATPYIRLMVADLAAEHWWLREYATEKYVNPVKKFLLLLPRLW